MAVIGAGPAGCAAACALAAEKVRTIVFEQGARGRDKPCGDGFTAPALRALEAMGAGIVPALTPKAEFQAIGLGIRRLSTSGMRVGPGDGYVMRRRHFDRIFQTWIGTLSGVQIRFETTVLDITEERSGLDGRGIAVSFREKAEGTMRTIRCDGVIVATGAQSKLSRKFDLDGAPEIGSALSLYVPEKAGELEMRFDAREGYFWRFPVSGSESNVGICGAGVPKNRLLDRLFRYVDPAFRTGGRSRGGVVPLWNGRSSVRHDESGILSCGDAAGLADPDTGEGLSMALISGQRAGLAMAAFVAGVPPTTALSDYSRDLDATLRSFYRPTARWRLLWRGHAFVARTLFD
ncbi:Dehydrogenase (flavoprotein) [Tistlia consotensis]|uniref:Dehydrogenase (Flavoprotein) n=1 Tax=Tistlia consotensis USBA 355 TaxID=560819 RepID=A0A1Y6CP48_9PROT|nr:FAD-dependent monooxygenase [Tistlia consotensis]SMF78930.1 Dehydrogenase (flavoprotein) [Tistlia consotensis USBA 355]SNS15287.1 Dehydrogenase (flavoprotein) [Tistlia consotensis]